MRAGEKQSHPVADIFPMMTAEEFAGLVEDIKANGLKEPIWLHPDGRIIDGRNRYKACIEAGVEPSFRTWDGEGSLVRFVVSLNLHRRHLNSSQRAIIGAKMLPMLEEEAKERQRDHGGTAPGKKHLSKSLDKCSRDGLAAQQAAKIAGTNRQYVSDAAKIVETKPELADKVLAGQMTIPQAKAEIKREEKRKQLEAKAAEAPAASDSWKIIHGDCIEELRKIEDSSARLIFADPPYNIGIDYGDGEQADRLDDDEYLDWCRQWIGACVSKLTPDGSFWLMICDEYADYFGIMLRQAGLYRRSWIKWYETFGVNCQNKFNRCSRHIFYCVKDPKRFVFNPDPVSRQSDRQAKYGDARANPAGKLWDDVWEIPRLTDTCEERMPGFPTQIPLAITRAIVGCASEPGDLVIDPFSGSGSTGVGAIESRRKYVGIEKNEQFAKASTDRLKVVSLVQPVRS
ncbi:MAG: DNA methyltransferase [Phycisphaerae bacterium]